MTKTERKRISELRRELQKAMRSAEKIQRKLKALQEKGVPTNDLPGESGDTNNVSPAQENI